MIHHSLAKLKWAGLTGLLDIEWGGEKELLTLDLEGQLPTVASLLPEVFYNPIQKSFQHHHVGISANVKRNFDQFEIEGIIHLVDQNLPDQVIDLMHFGCELRTESQDKLVPNGWFCAKQILLEKFVSPFIFPKSSLQLSGIGELIGSFNPKTIMIHYHAKDLKLENEDLLIEVESLHPSASHLFMGIHTFDLETFAHQGCLPIQQASYLEKHSGLLFNEIQTQLLFKDQMIHLECLEAFCQEIYLAGSLDLDYRDPSPGVFNIQFSAPAFHGKVSQLQSFLSHLKSPQLMGKIPLEGDIESRHQGIKLIFDFMPGDYHLQANIQGSITNGYFPFQSKNLTLQGVYMDFDYDHQKQILDLTDIQGTLLVGKSKRVEEYLVAGDHISFRQLERPEIDVDICVSDKSHRLMRLVGHTKENDDALTEIVLDKSLSHFGTLYPTEIELTLRDWTEVELFHLEAFFQLESLIPDLQQFNRMNLLFLPRDFRKRIDDLKEIKGNLALAINYDHSQDLLTYQVNGGDISWDRFTYQSLNLRGKKQEKKWLIDYFQLDRLSLSTEIQHRQDKWKINFLGVNYGHALLLGLEGDLSLEEKSIEAKVNICEAHLAYLDEWEFLKAFTSQYPLEGHVKGTGQIKIEWLGEFPWYRLESTLQVTADQFEVKDCLLNITQPIQLHFRSDQDLTINHLDIVLLKKHHYHLKDIHLELEGNQLQFSALSHIEQCPFPIQGFTSWPALDKGELILNASSPPLRIQWKEHPETGFIIQSIQGSFYGLNISLVEASSESQFPLRTMLQGDIEINFNHWGPYLTETMLERIQKLELGKSYYVLRGLWWMNSNLGHSLLENIYFQGRLHGQETVFKGYQVKQVEAELCYTPQLLEVKNILIQDTAGTIICPELKVIKNQQIHIWQLFSPKLIVKNFRPSLLQDMSHPSFSKFKTLLIRRIHLYDFYGDLDDIATWQAFGDLYFLNPSRKNLSHPILAIPAEVILRLGLNPEVLNPVTGTIYFNLQGDRFYFTKFKDVYSEGRGSKFYLAQGVSPSWMDMNGNLSIQIGMKQYNLIFKIAELFTVSIQGTVKKPKYFLQKHVKLPRKGH